MLTRSLLGLALLVAPGVAQASFTPFGTGCNPNNPPPLIRATGLPVLGTTFTVGFTALPSGRTPVSEDWPMFMLGLQQVQVPVPALSALQPPNCFLYTSTDILVPMPWLGSAFANQIAILIPANAQLIGLTLYMQWAELYSRCQTACVPGMIRVTNAAAATLGL